MKKTVFVFLLALTLVAGVNNPAIATDPQATNHDPVIFVHGWLGWAQDELGSLQYWGGLTNLQQEMRDRGHDVYMVSVSPVASNWDRACELYAQIKGGTVHYGNVHSSYAGHRETVPSKTHPGVFPEWGTLDPATGKKRQIHLIGHSMGGQTIRMLAQLLENGDPNEQAFSNVYGLPLAPLFSGAPDNKGLINSVTTISAPHDGNSLVYYFSQLYPQLTTFFNFLTSFGTIDLQLEQWGIFQQPGESAPDYIFRALLASPMAASWDNSITDLSPEGAAYLNTWVRAQPDVYYFTHATNATYPTGARNYENPLPVMTDYLKDASLLQGQIMGTFGSITLNENWWPNDGMVSTSSQDGPTLGSMDVTVAYSPERTPQKGVFNFVQTLRATDHYAVLGVTEKENNWPADRVIDFYDNLVTGLKRLPTE